MPNLTGNQQRWSRRTFLVRFGVFGAGASLLAACGPAAPPSPTTGAPPPPTAAAAAATIAPVATAAPGVTPTPAVASGAAPTPAAAAAAGTLTVAIPSFGPERFDRAFATTGDEFTRVVHGFLLSSDFKDGKRLAIAPGIASKWGVSQDGRSWTFTIRNGVKFHDGTAVTVDDVLWTLQHVIGPNAQDYSTQSISLTYSKNMERIEQTGPDEVTVTTKTPVSTLEQDLSEAGQSWTSAIYPKRAAVHDLPAEQAYDRNPIGAGIMKLVDHVPATSMTFERFGDYYYQPANGFAVDKRVKFQKLQLVLLPDESTRAAALRAGQVDIGSVGLGSRQQVEAGGGRLVFGPEAGYVYASWYGAFRPEFPCHDKRVRQALSYAIDRKSLRDSLWGAQVMQIVGWTDVTPSTVGYSPETDPFPFDLDKARQLLADAGYAGGNGFGKLILNTQQGQAVTNIPEAAQVVADGWRKNLGLDVEVRVGDSTALKNTYTTTEGLYGQLLMRDNNTRLDALTNTWRTYGGGTGFDRATDDSEVTALVNSATGIFDRVEREKALNVVYKRLADEQYDMSIGAFNVPWGVGPRVQTWQPYPLALYPSALDTITLK